MVTIVLFVQVNRGHFDLELNLALLRFYQFEPDLLNIDIVALILCQALTLLPDAQFKICLHLLSESAQVCLVSDTVTVLHWPCSKRNLWHHLSCWLSIWKGHDSRRFGQPLNPSKTCCSRVQQTCHCFVDVFCSSSFL